MDSRLQHNIFSWLATMFLWHFLAIEMISTVDESVVSYWGVELRSGQLWTVVSYWGIELRSGQLWTFFFFLCVPENTSVLRSTTRIQFFSVHVFLNIFTISTFLVLEYNLNTIFLGIPEYLLNFDFLKQNSNTTQEYWPKNRVVFELFSIPFHSTSDFQYSCLTLAQCQ